MRLKPAGIIIIVLIIAVLAYLALKPRLSNTRSSTATEQTTTSADGSKDTAASTNTTAPTNKANSNSRSFNYTPEKPVNGILRGVVEVGATGFNSFIINMDD